VRRDEPVAPSHSTFVSSESVRGAKWLGVAAIVWVACERDARTPTPRHVIDACALVTESDASELFGRPAARKPAVSGE
jgi:hypothetical protein